MNFRLAIMVSLAAALSLPTAADCRSDESAKPDKPAADSMLGKKLGQVRDDNELKMKLMWCPPGFVTMEQVERAEEPITTDENEDDEAAPKTRRLEKITPVKMLLTRGYWLGKYEVTQAEWKQVMKTEPWKGQEYTKEGADYLATFVSWNDALDFCRKMTELERQAGRLSNDWEWCRDIYVEKLPGGRDPEVKSEEKPRGSSRAVRGGGWCVVAALCRSRCRIRNQPDYRTSSFGFRPASVPSDNRPEACPGMTESAGT